MDVHRRRRGATPPTPAATAAASAVPTRLRSRPRRAPPPPSPPTPAPSADGSSTGSGSDVAPADHRRPDRPRRRGRLPPEPTQPPTRPVVIRDGLGRVAARVSGALGLAIGLAVFLPATVAAHTLNATYTSRLPLAVYLVGAATTVALSFIFVIVRDVRAAPPDLDAEGSLPPAWLRYALRAHRPHRLDLDHRPGDRRRLERRRRRDALPVGLRLGRAGDHLRARRAGLALPRPVLDPPRHRRLRSCAGSASRAGRSPTIPSVSVAGRPSSASRSSSGSSSSSSPAPRRCSSCSSATPRSRWR